MEIQIRDTIPSDREFAMGLMEDRWGGSRIVSRGRVVEALALPGLIALAGECPAGLLTYLVDGPLCEVVTLDSLLNDHGVGSALLEAVDARARNAGCRRLCLITTNDNLHALGFYQKRGFAIKSVRSGAMEESRKTKPSIPLLGADGIPLRDEIFLEKEVNDPCTGPLHSDPSGLAGALNWEEKIPIPLDKRFWHPGIIPGPVFLVSTVNSAGEWHFAPKSWVQMAAFDPPTLLFSGSSENLTERNIMETGCFTLNLVNRALADLAFGCIESSGRERVARSRLTAVPGQKVASVSIAQSPAHLECRLRDTHCIGSGTIFFGEIEDIRVKREILEAPHWMKYDLLEQVVFLEDGVYGTVTPARVRPGDPD